MKIRHLGTHKNRICLWLPDEYADVIDRFFGQLEGEPLVDEIDVELVSDVETRCHFLFDGVPFDSARTIGHLVAGINAALEKMVVGSPDTWVANAGAVGWGDKSILVVGDKGHVADAVAWLVAKGFSFLGQTHIHLDEAGFLSGMANPLAVSSDLMEDDMVHEAFCRLPSVKDDKIILIRPDEHWLPVSPNLKCALILYMQRRTTRELEIAPIKEGLLLDAIDRVNADPSKEDKLLQLVRSTPAISVAYSLLADLNVFTEAVLFDVLDSDAGKSEVEKALIAWKHRSVRPEK